LTHDCIRKIIETTRGKVSTAADKTQSMLDLRTVFNLFGYKVSGKDVDLALRLRTKLFSAPT
jgi:hypothetical protein